MSSSPQAETSVWDWLGYEPHPIQQAFHQSPCKYRALIAGVRGGKTYGGIAESLLHALHPEWHGSYGWIVAPTFPMLRDINIAGILDVLRKIRRRPKFQWSKTDKILRFPDTNSIIQFKSAEDPDLLRGVGLDWLWIDEGSFVKRSVWEVLFTRLDKAWSRAWITTTPKGLDWVYEEIYDRAKQHQPDGTITFGKHAHPDYEAWRFFTTQNTKAPQLKSIAEAAKQRLSPEFFRQEYEASFERFTGLIYKDFDPRKHVREFTVDPNWETWVSIDPGATDPTAILFVAIDFEGGIYVWDESYESNRTIPYHAEVIKQKLAGRPPYMVLIDPSAKQEALDFALYDIPVTESELSKKRDIRAGILRVQEFIRLNRLMVHPRCENLLRELNRYEWDDSMRKDRNQGDRPKDSHNHALDALRYIAMMQPEATPRIIIGDFNLTHDQIIQRREKQQLDAAFNEVGRIRHSQEDCYDYTGCED